MTKHILNDLPQQKVSGSIMKHPLVGTARCLTGMALVLLGLSAYGCGDTGSSTEPAELGSISVSPGLLDPPFNPATTSYVAKVSSNVSSTTITATPRVAGDTIRIDNQQVSSQTITLDTPGAEKSVNIVVTETGTGGTSKSYTVQVKRDVEDTTLTALSVSTGTLSPSTFDKDTPNYTVNDIGNTVNNVTVSATKSNPNTVMQIASVTVPAGTPSGQANVSLGAPGSTTRASIIVTAQGGGSNTYTVSFNRGASDNNFLRSLAVSSGSTALSLVPRFNQTATAYTVNVANTIGTVSVTPRVDDATARITVNGQAATSGQAQTITLNPAGANPSQTTIPIVVTAQNGNPRTYSVNVIRAALNGNTNLRGLTVLPGNLTFDPNDQQYDVNLLSNVTSVRITAAPENGNASVTINGQPSPTTITIGAPGPEIRITVPVVVTAQNARDQKTYNISFIRAALGGNFNLQSLTVPPHTLSPTFSQSTTRYTLNVGNNVGSITVNAAPQDTGASVGFFVSNAQTTNPISLPPGLSTTEVEIRVTAQNGARQPYFISVTRAAPSSNTNLSALSVTAGTTVTPFSPPFDSNTVTVAPEITEVLVRADKDDANATMAIGGNTVPQGTKSGQATFQLNGAGGEPTTISFTVTPQSGVNPKTYTISVIRPAAPTPPAKPVSAPDLIPADDSCPLRLGFTPPPTNTNDDCAKDSTGNFFGTRDDNFTNVTTPRFVIPQPSAGHTPNLYVNGSKVGSVFDAATNTLQPTTPLSGSNNGIQYSITSTVTNTGTTLESVQSDALVITISNGQSGV